MDLWKPIVAGLKFVLLTLTLSSSSQGITATFAFIKCPVSRERREELASESKQKQLGRIRRVYRPEALVVIMAQVLLKMN